MIRCRGRNVVTLSAEPRDFGDEVVTEGRNIFQEVVTDKMEYWNTGRLDGGMWRIDVRPDIETGVSKIERVRGKRR